MLVIGATGVDSGKVRQNPEGPPEGPPAETGPQQTDPDATLQEHRAVLLGLEEREARGEPEPGLGGADCQTPDS